MFLFFATILQFSSNPLCAQQHWEQKRSGNGITVFQADSDSKFKTVKVQALLTGSKTKLVKILQAVDRNTEWVYATKRSHLVEKISDSNLIYYAETALPWPMKNRDQPIHLVIHPETGDSILTITTIGEPDRLPINTNLVRIQKFSGTWKVKTVSPTQISIDYLLNVDPSGSVPAWLVNIFVSKGPFETFSKLAEKLKE
jgi:hypothetical protein